MLQTRGPAVFNKRAVTPENVISGNIEILGKTKLISSRPVFKCTVLFELKILYVFEKMGWAIILENFVDTGFSWIQDFPFISFVYRCLGKRNLTKK